MSDVVTSNTAMTEVSEKPVSEKEEIKFPPFPEPKDEDFDEDIPEDERNHYKTLYIDLNMVTSMKLHCSACDRHLGCSARNDNRMRVHPMLRTLVCQTCHSFYNSGEFEKGDDGSELYCRWCGQGGQVYCCSDCPHVFCAKCIRRNLGTSKIKEIEDLDDWKCFKCNNRCLWDLRALCWAVIRYCDLKNKITYEIEDPVIKEACQKSCAQDYSECCKNKTKKKEKQEAKKKELNTSKNIANVYKLPPTIQVKKFASISMEEKPESKPEKKAQKRPASPKNKGNVKNQMASIPSKLISQMTMPTVPKKIRMSSSPVINPVRFNNDRKMTPNFACYTSRLRAKTPSMPVMYNGFNSTPTFGDNINLSLESLTQGLDMSAITALAGSSQDDDVVCTPDFPMEPLCEVTEDPVDDDVQCITPGPVAVPKTAPPAPRLTTLPDLNPENIIQMTDNDVTVNATTGGLKFRVDPQTLSSNKMYRLPDGRIFAINANPNMPGGYSATIVAVTADNSVKTPQKGTTFAAKLSAVPPNPAPPPPPLKFVNRNQTRSTRRSTPKTSKASRTLEPPTRVADLNVPVEWYRYNLVDAIDALEYSLSKLHQLKKDATTMHLRTRTTNEMRLLHRSLERSLTTSMTRFKEIRDNLNKEYKQYVNKKSVAASTTNSDDDDDDDVEILHEDTNDDPIYIDENSIESTQDNHEVDLTAAGSSDFNDSGEKSPNKDGQSKDPLNTEMCQNASSDPLGDNENCTRGNGHLEEQNVVRTTSISKETDKITLDDEETAKDCDANSLKENEKENEISTNDMNGQTEKSNDASESDKIDKLEEDNILNDSSDTEKKIMDSEISDEMIEDLLKDDNVDDDMVGNGADDAVISKDDDTADKDDDVVTKDDTAADKDDTEAGKNNDAAERETTMEDDSTAVNATSDATGNGDNIETVHSLDVLDKIQNVLESDKDL